MDFGFDNCFDAFDASDFEVAMATAFLKSIFSLSLPKKLVAPRAVRVECETMKLKDALEHYNFYTGKASEISRQLCFAGLAIIWIFKADRPALTTRLPAALIIPGVLLSLALLLDFLQYAYCSIAWDCFHDKKEHEAGVTEETEFFVPKVLNRPGAILFYGKMIGAALAYIILIGYLFAQLT